MKIIYKVDQQIIHGEVLWEMFFEKKKNAIAYLKKAHNVKYNKEQNLYYSFKEGNQYSGINNSDYVYHVIAFSLFDTCCSEVMWLNEVTKKFEYSKYH